MENINFSSHPDIGTLDMEWVYEEWYGDRNWGRESFNKSKEEI